MKRIFLLTLFLFGCNKFSTIQPYTVNNIALQIQTSQISTIGQLPISEGCQIELLQNPLDGGVIINPNTGEFNYFFQDLSITLVGEDSFSFRHVCENGTSQEFWVLIDTSDIPH